MDKLLDYDPIELPLVAPSSHWRKYRNPPETGGDGGLTEKTGAQHRDTGQRAIIKTGWPGTSVKELTWSRLARLVGLPAAPAQLIMPRRSSSAGLGVIIWLVESGPADWLWTATTPELQAKGVAVKTVSRLKAFVLWTSAAGANEIGEFRLASDGMPFVVDHQDSLFISGLATTTLIAPRVLPVAYLHRIFPDDAQLEEAVSFWRGLAGQVRQGWPALEAAHVWPPLLEPTGVPTTVGRHLDRILAERDPARLSDSV